MRILIVIYLLAKSALGRKFTWLDIGLAQAIWTSNRLAYGRLFGLISTPTWILMIAEMQQEIALPEAFTDFKLGIEEEIQVRVHAWLED